MTHAGPRMPGTAIAQKSADRAPKHRFEMDGAFVFAACFSVRCGKFDLPRLQVGGKKKASGRLTPNDYWPLLHETKDLMELRPIDELATSLLRERYAGGKHWLICVDLGTWGVLERIAQACDVEIFRDPKFPFLIATLEKQEVSPAKLRSLLRQAGSVNIKETHLATMTLIVIGLKDLNHYAEMYACSVLGINDNGATLSNYTVRAEGVL